MQCVGIDIAKSTFTACLCMYEFDTGCSTAPVVFNNNKTDMLGLMCLPISQDQLILNAISLSKATHTSELRSTSLLL